MLQDPNFESGVIVRFCTQVVTILGADGEEGKRGGGGQQRKCVVLLRMTMGSRHKNVN